MLKSSMCALSNDGFSCREPRKVIGISKSSVQSTIKRFEETGDFHDRRHSADQKN